MKRTVPLKDVLDFMTKEAKAARKEALGIMAFHNETCRWDAFRMRHYAASVEQVRDMLRDFYNGY